MQNLKNNLGFIHLTVLLFFLIIGVAVLAFFLVRLDSFSPAKIIEAARGGNKPSPSPSIAKNVKVLVIKYFPLDSTGTNLDSTITGLSDTLTDIRSKVNSLNQTGISKLTQASRYHYYSNSQAPNYLSYTIIDDKEFLEAMPLSTNKIPWNTAYRPDYNQILNRVNICNYIDGQEVKQVWLWGYHYGNLEPVESDMSMGRLSQSFWNHGSFGDVSNSEQIDDLPLCNKTYTLFNYNYGRGVAEFLEGHNHQLEAIFGFVDSSLFDTFKNPHGLTDGTVNHCGWTHSPPNVTDDQQYLWSSETVVKSDCADWKPEGGGLVKDTSCHTWYGKTCLVNGGTEFRVWWMQSLPGYNNGLTYQGRTLRNWWEFVEDFDTALTKGKTL